MQRRFEYSMFVLIALCLVSPVRACMNDRDSDSLAEEGRDLPDVVRVITGRFERNPPLFYQMRVDRVQQELQKSPRNFNLYDDISVACDRLGRSGEAIAWIEKKRALLPQFNAQDRVLKEHWYRYYANGGTFWAHRWLHNGANRKNIAQMVRARDMIARAIQIKPNAHFGREKYQLAAMNWIIKPPTDGTGSYIPAFIKRNFYDDKDESAETEAAIKGYTGLIVLGNAWESVDVFNNLKAELQKGKHGPLGFMAQLRCQELIDKGKSSLFPMAIHRGLEEQRFMVTKSGRHIPEVLKRDKDEIKRAYKTLRAEAEAWQVARTKYITVRLTKGQHPDTDKTFWNEYSNSTPPSLESLTPRTLPRWWRATFSNPTTNMLYMFCGVLSIVPLLFIRKLWKRRHHKTVY